MDKEFTKSMGRPLYLLAAGLALVPWIDAGRFFLPPHPGSPVWRFSLAASASDYSLGVTGAICLAAVVAASRSSSRGCRWVSLAAGALSAFAILGLVVFLFDARGVSAGVISGQEGRFLKASIIGSIKFVLLAFTNALVFFSVRRMMSEARSVEEPGARAPAGA